MQKPCHLNLNYRLCKILDLLDRKNTVLETRLLLYYNLSQPEQFWSSVYSWPMSCIPHKRIGRMFKQSVARNICVLLYKVDIGLVSCRRDARTEQKPWFLTAKSSIGFISPGGQLPTSASTLHAKREGFCNTHASHLDETSLMRDLTDKTDVFLQYINALAKCIPSCWQIMAALDLQNAL